MSMINKRGKKMKRREETIRGGGVLSPSPTPPHCAGPKEERRLHTVGGVLSPPPTSLIAPAPLHCAGLKEDQGKERREKRE